MKFQYKIVAVAFSDQSAAEAALNDLGQQGWDMCGGPVPMLMSVSRLAAPINAPLQTLLFTFKKPIIDAK